ncbi:MAG: HEAT repeat domain-containing protein [Promethearchaeia archaeon]
MTFLSIDPEKYEKLISKGKYQIASDEIFEIIKNSQYWENKELIYKLLNLLNLICDKSPSIALETTNIIENFINDRDSWIRLICLEILYQLSIYRPTLLIDLLDKIRTRLFDTDSAVRRLAVKLVGNLILRLHLDEYYLNEIIEEFIQKLMDNDWKVKFYVIKIIKKILKQDYTKIRDLEPLLSIVIINLRDEDDDVARSAAELLKILGTYFLSKEKIFYVLLNLLYNEKPRVKELIIWLFGEIGKERSSEIIPIIPKMIKLLREDDFRIQIKLTDALVNIAENNFDQIWSNLLNALETSDIDYKNKITNVLYHLGKKHILEIFPYMFEALESPSENVQEAIALVFKRLFEEYRINIENEITRIIYNLESKYWRERRNTITLLKKICLILNSRKIATWIIIELQKALKLERDPDVIKEFNSAISILKIRFKGINKEISKINEEINKLNERINEFQRIPAQFRKSLNSYLKDFKINETELKLNEDYEKILKDIKKFDKKINNFEYKRLAFDLLEEWEEIKIQIIDELGIIKGFISDIIEEKKQDFITKLKNQLKIIDDRISVLKLNFDYIRENHLKIEHSESGFSNILFNDDVNYEEKFSVISKLRENLFKLEVDIRDLLLDNIEFDDYFKDVLRRWISVKIEIQKYLGELDREIRALKEEIFEAREKDVHIMLQSELTNKTKFDNIFAIQLLQSNIQSIISQGINGFKKINENLNKFNSKFNYFLKRNKFVQAKKLIREQSSQIQSFIEQIENQLDNLIGKEKLLEDNNIFNRYARPYIEKWNISKELLINKLKVYIRKSREKLYLTQFKHYLKIVNPINFKHLASYVGLEVEQIKELVFKFIKKNQLRAKIIRDMLYSPKIEEQLPTHKELLFFKNIKTLRNKIFLDFKLSNPSNYKYYDIQISLQVPKFLIIDRKESFPNYINLSEIKPGKSFKFHYILKIDKEMRKSLMDPNIDEITLKIYYKDAFRINRRITKKIDLIFP